MSDEKETKPSPFSNEPNYDLMSDEEYMKEMEAKVEYYKIHYPDMYEKAMQWLSMLEHSEMYKTHSGEETLPKESPLLLKAQDIIKNATFNGLSEDDLTVSERTLLDEHIPDWKDKLNKE